MKKFNAFICAALLLSTQNYTIDVQENLNWCGQKIQTYGKDLMNDTTTQLVTISSVTGSIIAYQYYYYNAALVCLDGHVNSRIMHKSNLVYMTYSDFVEKIATINSYAETFEFIEEHCTSYCCISDVKINKLIALVNDLQTHNNKRRNDDTVEQENMVLETFKANVLLAQENIRQELINGAISANKNANNAYTITTALRIIGQILQFFGNN